MPSLKQAFRQGSFGLFTTLLIAQTSAADSLSDIYQSAVQNDPVMRAARANLNADREIKNINRAALLPQLSASGEYRESETNDDSRSIFIIEGQTLSSVSQGLIDSSGTSYNVSLSQAIWKHAKQKNALSSGS
jgi:outer membrane protein